jgi:hypothetical protein
MAEALRVDLDQSGFITLLAPSRVQEGLSRSSMPSPRRSAARPKPWP